MIKATSMILALVTLFQAGCDEHKSFPELTSVSKIVVVTNERKRIKEVTDPKQIMHVVDFVNVQRTDWRSPIAGVPVPRSLLNSTKAISSKEPLELGTASLNHSGPVFCYLRRYLTRMKLVFLT